jgi:hypothetical protein
MGLNTKRECCNLKAPKGASMAHKYKSAINQMREEAKLHTRECPVQRALTMVADWVESLDGPSQVATPAYRENWGTIFGKKTVPGQA